MRIFTASLATETNSFSPIPTNRESYEQTLYFPPGEHPDRGTLCTGPLWAARRRAKQEGFELIEGSCFWAEPSAPTLQTSYESMRDEILAQLRAALPVDGVLLGLHGAMIAQGYDDAEGDLIARVRAIAGPDAVIGVELDDENGVRIARKKVTEPGCIGIEPSAVEDIPVHHFDGSGLVRQDPRRGGKGFQ